VADDEAVALYGTVKRMVQAMAEREAALEAKTATLDAAIASLQQLPATLGKQTSQSIEKGVRASIQEDLKWPVKDALKEPLDELRYATNQARDVIREVRRESKFQGWTTMALLVTLGVALGVTSSYYFFIRALGNINDRLETIQQQITAPAPTSDAKPAGKPGKVRQSH
jgi:hypothetical protein